MAEPAVVAGAPMTCSFGAGAGSLVVVPASGVTVGGLPVAVITDSAPMVNVMPFGMCNSLANPTVATATAAAFGVLTPMPCVPVIASPWAPGAPTTLVGGRPVVTASSKCLCVWGGVIQLTAPGQFTTTVA